MAKKKKKYFFYISLGWSTVKYLIPFRVLTYAFSNIKVIFLKSTSNVINYSIEDHQWVLKSLDKRLLVYRIFSWQQNTIHRLIMNCKEKIYLYNGATWWSPLWVINISLTNSETTWPHVPPKMMQKAQNITHKIFLVQNV